MGGVLGAAILFGMISFFKMIAALGRWNAWKNNGVPVRARVTAIATQLSNYKNKKGVTFYQYALEVNHGGRRSQGLLEETVGPNETPKLSPGSQVDVLYNPANGVCKCPEDMKGQVKSNALAMLGCIAIAAGCILLVNLING